MMRIIYTALLFMAFTSGALAGSYSAESHVKNMCDVVVYGTAIFPETPPYTNNVSCFPPHTNNVSWLVQKQVNGKPTSTNSFRRIIILPHKYLPEQSPRYFWSHTYAIVLSESYYQRLLQQKEMYTTQPRFWGIRRGSHIGDSGGPIRITRASSPYAKLQAEIEREFSDPTRIRPLDLRPIASTLDIQLTRQQKKTAQGTQGRAVFSNNSDFSVWINKRDEERLTYGRRGDFSHVIEILRDENWRIGDMGPFFTSKEAVAHKVPPHTKVEIPVNLPPVGKYDGYRMQLIIYPDDSFVNSIAIYSNGVR